jgi:hypothetical protein
VFFRDIFNSLRESGIDIRLLEADEWNTEYGKALKDKEKAKYLLSLFAYKSRESQMVNEPVAAVNTYTIETLDRFGFIWPIVTGEYLSKFINTMKGLGYYDYR